MSAHPLEIFKSLLGLSSGSYARKVMAAAMWLCWVGCPVHAQDAPQASPDSKGPQFNWVLTDKPAVVCAKANKDGTHAIADACSYWLIQERRCTLVTKSDQTSHHVLGILFSACQRGLHA
ncbi:hypothetical protein B9Z51_16380 [Limnohabitans sp. T6-5]|uniref:hypothetical protein n=1 Tax=Limnohabitans sp. T6-5 TaxID=1100724 RepID=UPI000D340B6D|nr:hypothetical protein [Limnohabitans sp. T6-5]PUE06388.1 hypothetical protein B9Z51_16380 [Limnohabitans sp. T6-5]